MASVAALVLALGLATVPPAYAQQITRGGGGATGGIAGGGGGAGGSTAGGSGGSAAVTPGGSAQGGAAGSGGAGGLPGSPNDISAGGGGGGGADPGGNGGDGGGGNVLSTTGSFSLGGGYLGSAGGGGGGGGGGLVLTGTNVGATTNGHVITGGSGGEGSGIRGRGGGGGAGLVLLYGGVVTTTGGTIGGGAGGMIGSLAGEGGAGLFLYAGGELAHQAGTIRGGNGGGIVVRQGNLGGDGGTGALSNLGTVINQAAIAGGDGGHGRSWGGNGGAGLEAWGGSIGNGVTGTITGGTGAATISAGAFISAGDGGAGVRFRDGQPAALTNAGTIQGGAGGSVVAGDNILGLGGAGVVDAASGAISIVNDGAIIGGVDSRGAMRADAISLFGSDNRLELHSNSVIVGNVVVSGGTKNKLVLGGGADGAYDVSQIGDLQQYRGFDTFEKMGSSTWTLTGTGAQDWSIVSGTLKGDTNSLAGDVTFASEAGSRGVVLDQDFDGAYGGAISGDGALTKAGAGTVTLTGSSSLDWTIAAGGLTTAAERFSGDAAIVAGGILTFDQAADAAYAGVLSGSGGLRKTGMGLLDLSGGSSDFTGTTFVENGTLAVNDSIGGVLEVWAAGRLQGTGTVGSTVVSGTVAPGNSIGTLNVGGDITFNTASVYEVEVDAAGQSDRIDATGTAIINGGVVTVLAGTGNYEQQTDYLILRAAAGIGGKGAFDGVTSNLAFLDPTLSYDANNIYLRLERNTTSFAGIGVTPNQTAVGTGAESLGPSNTVYDAVADLSADQARAGGGRPLRAECDDRPVALCLRRHHS